MAGGAKQRVADTTLGRRRAPRTALRPPLFIQLRGGDSGRPRPRYRRRDRRIRSGGQRQLSGQTVGKTVDRSARYGPVRLSLLTVGGRGGGTPHRSDAPRRPAAPSSSPGPVGAGDPGGGAQAEWRIRCTRGDDLDGTTRTLYKGQWCRCDDDVVTLHPTMFALPPYIEGRS